MQYLRLFIMIAFVSGWLHSVNAAGLFGGPKTLPDDGTYGSGSGVGGTFSNPGGSCQVTCNSSKGEVQVDIKTRCMCISGSDCFKIDIGRAGTFTTNGLGKMGPATGTSYRTKPGSGNSKNWDNDAVSMGIQSNTAYGKWIHKSRSCGGGGASTIGCIGIPCERWPEVKAVALSGKSLQVCNGVNHPTSIEFPECRGGVACYKNISPSEAAKDRFGLYVPKKNSGDGSGRGQGQTR